MSDPTNTLILTGFSDEEINDKELIHTLQQQIIDNTPSMETIKFSILRSFRRILVVFEEINSSATLYSVLKQCGFKVGFSSQNNYDDFILTEDGYKFDTREYLHLPPHGTTFIISPPPSPPPGWKSFPEEAPEQRAIYSPEELSELLYRRVEDGKLEKLFNLKDVSLEEAPTFDMPKKSELQHTQEVLLESNSEISSPIIVLEAPENEQLDLGFETRNKAPVKVAMPPTD